SVQPIWPRGTRVLEFGANADELAQLISDWTRARPAMFRDVIWYRIPTETDARNWRWPTLTAVMTGRSPTHKLEVTSEGENPIDLAFVNRGEAEERFAGEVAIDWNDAALISSDALPGWTLRAENNRAVFEIADGNALRLSPGERRDIGWLRYDRTTKPRLSLSTTR
ncbi:MAG: DUF3142 domain-containing protein, partial [Verrucomicrobia bacterium]|nr:DUF3142 domain-containing protein [Verrucomicrobiota bacterium]